jgi:ABC-2 type transport system permease protein
VSAYLLCCLLANALSILAPMPMAAGSMQPSQVKMIPVLLQFVFLMVLPFVLLPVMIPIGIEVLLAEVADVRGWPVSLVLSLLVLAVTVSLYRIVVTWEGRWLTEREKAILEAVTSKEE